jgi:hypothetical protein
MRFPGRFLGRFLGEISICRRNNLFWPIVIAFGPGFAAVYYDHDARSFADRSVCERTLPGLEKRAKLAKDFMAAMTEAAGNQTPSIVYRPACIDKTPQQFQRDLETEGKENET